tara:strand:+ start:1747 stop:1923 length:177 start_codon:yes stop_codon:yes gene_type:complete
MTIIMGNRIAIRCVMVCVINAGQSDLSDWRYNGMFFREAILSDALGIAFAALAASISG